LQFHGAADLYAVDEGVTLATLSRDLDTDSNYPAAVQRGRAVAFAFDVARSIGLTRQGNPDWQNSEGDGNNSAAPAFHATDLFSRHDGRLWYEPQRLRVPQADELQRFFANVVLDLVASPLPRLWYLPRTHKWLIVNTIGNGRDQHTPRLA
jgi:hypothetical protein